MGDPRFRAPTGIVSYELYDFRRPDKLSKEQLRSLQLLHEAFCTHLSSSLGGHLRTPVQIDLVSLEQVPYDDYMKSISASLLHILNVTNLSGQMIFELDFGVLFSMIDRLLGGKGEPAKMVRDLTDIETMLAENIMHHVLEDLRSAWSNIAPLDFDVASTETSSQFVQIVPGNDTVVLVLLEMKMGDFQGAMSLCIPYLLIKPILGKLSSQRWLTKNNQKPSMMYAVELQKRLLKTRVPCVARLGSASLTVEDLAYLNVGQIIPMSIPEQDQEHTAARRIGTVELLIGGNVKFRGKTGLNGAKLAVQIEEIVQPVPDLIVHRDVN